MPYTHVLGYPRIGARRELKFALESCWKGETNTEQLEEVAARLRLAHWQRQRDAGLDLLTAGDFTLYDHVLDHALMFGALPRRFRSVVGETGTATVFALARGTSTEPALEMTKWFDTNYHLSLIHI